MAIRKTNIYKIECPYHTEQVEEIMPLANSLIAYVKYLCKQNDYACKMFIGVSKNDGHYSKAEFVRTGKKGRPKKEFKRDPIWKNLNVEHEVNPHMHIFICANPGETVSNKCIKYLNKKTNTKSYRKGYHQGFLTDYVMGQSLYTRQANCDENDVLSDFNFEDLIRHEEELFLEKFMPRELRKH